MIRDLLEDCREYFDDRADVQYIDGVPVANEAKRLLDRVNAALRTLAAAEAAQ